METWWIQRGGHLQSSQLIKHSFTLQFHQLILASSKCSFMSYITHSKHFTYKGQPFPTVTLLYWYYGKSKHHLVIIVQFFLGSIQSCSKKYLNKSKFTNKSSNKNVSAPPYNNTCVTRKGYNWILKSVTYKSHTHDILVQSPHGTWHILKTIFYSKTLTTNLIKNSIKSNPRTPQKFLVVSKNKEMCLFLLISYSNLYFSHT